MGTIGQRLTERIDHPKDHCLGKCGRRLLKYYYFCVHCEPEGWDRYNPDLEVVKSLHAGHLRKAKAQPGTLPTTKKARNPKQEAEQAAYKAMMKENK